MAPGTTTRSWIPNHLLDVVAVALIGVSVYLGLGAQATGSRLLIAHRGASAYAPEHTRAAYELAIRQGADFIEPDLAVTSDGALVAMHDDTLDRTTDVEGRFPDRARTIQIDGRPARRWFVADFTLAELRTLDAGAWHDPAYAGEGVLTFEEVLAIARGRAGVVPELKSPGLYKAGGHDPVSIFAAVLERYDLTGASPATRVIAQSFDEPTVRALARALPDVPRMLLLDAKVGAARLSRDGLAEIKTFATAIGPNKTLIDRQPEIVRRAQAIGLAVMPWTFRSSSAERRADVAAEMRYFLHELGVDGLFTDNPDLFPRPGGGR